MLIRVQINSATIKTTRYRRRMAPLSAHYFVSNVKTTYVLHSWLQLPSYVSLLCLYFQLYFVLSAIIIFHRKYLTFKAHLQLSLLLFSLQAFCKFTISFLFPHKFRSIYLFIFFFNKFIEENININSVEIFLRSFSKFL